MANPTYLCPECGRVMTEAGITQTTMTVGAPDVYGITRTIATRSLNFICPDGHGMWTSHKDV